jgi:hypothetical protein
MTRRLGEPRRLLRAGGTIISEIQPIKGVSLRFFSFFQVQVMEISVFPPDFVVFT